MTERKTIRQLREERGWTRSALAARLRVDPGTIHKWEQELRTPHPRTQRRLAIVFGVEVADIAFTPAGQAPQQGEQP